MPTVAVNPSGPTIMQPRMRLSQSQTHKHAPTWEELAKINQDILSNAKQAQEFLKRQGYTPADAQGNWALLSYTLLLLAHSAPPASYPKESTIENIKRDIGKATEELHTTTTQTEAQHKKGTTETGVRTTYPDALSTQLPMTHTRTLAQSWTHNR